VKKDLKVQGAKIETPKKFPEHLAHKLPTQAVIALVSCSLGPVPTL